MSKTPKTDKSSKKSSYGFAIRKEGPFYGTHPTRKTAADDCLEQNPFELEDGDTFFTGKNVGRQASHYCDGAKVLQTLVDQASEEVGELADEWIVDVSPEQVEELTEELGRVLDRWAKSIDKHPAWMAVEDIEEHTVGES